MRTTEFLVTVCVSALPIVGALIILWSDVQTLKIKKADYREVAELKTDISKQLSRNTEAIENLNKLINKLINERNNNEQKAGSY